MSESPLVLEARALTEQALSEKKNEEDEKVRLAGKEWGRKQKAMAEESIQEIPGRVRVAAAEGKNYIDVGTVRDEDSERKYRNQRSANSLIATWASENGFKMEECKFRGADELPEETFYRLTW